tara:strand:+ start:407 stop:613 length:207 start_codon:yes stop_codon:yes gene_type:complete
MRKSLIALLAAIALPTAANATNYVECEAIYQVALRQQRLWRENMYDSKYDEAYKRALKDFKKRGCYYY